MNIYLEVVLRTLFSIVVLLVLARISGAKQISQLTFYDYIVGISAGSIAATMCIEMDVPILVGLIGVVLFMLSGVLFSFLTGKSIVLRRVITGAPIFLIAHGEILYKGLKRTHLDVTDLLRELRCQGYFNVAEIHYAILEANGHLSVLPKAYARPATVQELALKVQEDGLNADVVIDGKILDGNVKAFGKNRQWLLDELHKQGVDDLKTVILATLDDQAKVTVFYKNNGNDQKRVIFQ